ncbi:hypothetical protein B0H16DRAFT_1466948 [Mycena metata]|uniref:Uncharacterized protein n=1 Tax=Mycena metata TaxID=1033252 RepID=A0AAD7MX19_9AGAR|nr:hypothetical protein B0H16DRAFT_1466948 [Mycena metata]
MPRVDLAINSIWLQKGKGPCFHSMYVRRTTAKEILNTAQFGKTCSLVAGCRQQPQKSVTGGVVDHWSSAHGPGGMGTSTGTGRHEIDGLRRSDSVVTHRPIEAEELPKLFILFYYILERGGGGGGTPLQIRINLRFIGREKPRGLQIGSALDECRISQSRAKWQLFARLMAELTADSESPYLGGFIRRIWRIRQMPSLRIAPHPSGPLKTFRIAPHLNGVFQNLNDMLNSLKATCQILQGVKPFTIILSLKMLSSLKAPVESFTIIRFTMTGRNEKIEMVWLLTVHVVQGANIYIRAVVAYIPRGCPVYLYTNWTKEMSHACLVYISGMNVHFGMKLNVRQWRRIPPSLCASETIKIY